MSFIKRIAIIGGSGQLGTPLLKALIDSGKFELTAITRDGSKSSFPSNVKVVRGDYDSQAFLESSLRDQEALITILATTAPKDLAGRIIEAAITASVPYILPTEFGPDTANTELVNAVPFFGPKKAFRDQIAASKASSFVAVINGLWFDFSLKGGFFGVNAQERTARLFDDGETRFSTTTLAQVGLGVAKLFELPLSELDKFKNSFMYIKSFTVSQNQILQSVQKATGTNAEDWKVTYVSSDAAIEQGMAEFKSGNFRGLLDVLYGNNAKKGMGGSYDEKLHNGVLGLKEEELDAVVKGIIENVEK